MITIIQITGFQPTLPVRGATSIVSNSAAALSISTHAPRAGSDRPAASPSARGEAISTHAPRAGSDRKASVRLSSVYHFNPRSPCGERRPPTTVGGMISPFQPTLPVRGATCAYTSCPSVHSISTHAPRAGSDAGHARHRLTIGEFQPTLPVRGATLDSSVIIPAIKISTHAPRAGSDFLQRQRLYFAI